MAPNYLMADVRLAPHGHTKRLGEAAPKRCAKPRARASCSKMLRLLSRHVLSVLQAGCLRRKTGTTISDIKSSEFSCFVREATMRFSCHSTPDRVWLDRSRSDPRGSKVLAMLAQIWEQRADCASSGLGDLAAICAQNRDRTGRRGFSVA